MQRSPIKPDELNARLAFIRELELPDLEPGGGDFPAARVDDKNRAGYVNDGSLVSFVAGLTAQQKSDTLNSVLLAQLAANTKFNRETQTRDWYDFFRTVLENVG